MEELRAPCLTYGRLPSASYQGPKSTIHVIISDTSSGFQEFSLGLSFAFVGLRAVFDEGLGPGLGSSALGLRVWDHLR